MTCAGRSCSRSLALLVSARTCCTWSSGKVLAITPRLMWSLRRMPAGRPEGARAIVAARPRESASMIQLRHYVNSIGAKPVGAVRVPGPSSMRELTEAHFTILRRHMVEVIAIHVELAADEIGKASLEPRVLAAMRQGARHRFVPTPLAPVAYQDMPLPIGFDKTISQPFVVAVM